MAKEGARKLAERELAAPGKPTGNGARQARPAPAKQARPARQAGQAPGRQAGAAPGNRRRNPNRRPNRAGISCKSTLQKTDLTQAKTYLLAAVRAEPQASQYRYEIAPVFAGLVHLYPSQAKGHYARAVSEQQVAVHWEPRDPAFSKYLAKLEKDLKSAG